MAMPNLRGVRNFLQRKGYVEFSTGRVGASLLSAQGSQLSRMREYPMLSLSRVDHCD